jgi:hypothetical protein
MTLVIAAAHQAIFRTRAEDAFIIFRYALNFARGNGIVFNPGERVEGYSNFAFLLTLAGLHRLFHVDIELAARTLGVIAGLLTILLTYRLASRLTNGDHYAGLLAALVLAASGSFAAWSPSGMETTIFALVTILLATFLTSKSRVGAGFLIGLATMTRPEGVFLFILAISDISINAQSWNSRTKTLLRVIVPFLALVAPWSLWRLYYYRHLIPNAIVAKQGMDPVFQIALGIVYLSRFARANYPFLALALVTVLLPVFKSRRELSSAPQMPSMIRSLGLFLLVYMLYVVLVGGDWMPAWRFFVPVLPLGSALLASLWSFNSADTFLSTGRRPAIGVFALGCAISVGVSLFSSNLLPLVRTWNAQVEGLCEIGRWLNRTLPSETLVGTYANGSLSYYSQLPTLDLLGLTDEHIARSGQRMREGPQGHIAFDYCYVAARRPALVSLAGGGFEPTPIKRVSRPELKPYYDPVSFWFPASRSPLGQYVNLLVLKSDEARIVSLLASKAGLTVIRPKQGIVD